MARLITTAPSVSLWASVESAVNLTLKSLSAPERPRNRAPPSLWTTSRTEIRRTARHWLVG